MKIIYGKIVLTVLCLFSVLFALCACANTSDINDDSSDVKTSQTTPSPVKPEETPFAEQPTELPETTATVAEKHDEPIVTATPTVVYAKVIAEHIYSAYLSEDFKVYTGSISGSSYCSVCGFDITEDSKALQPPFWGAGTVDINYYSICPNCKSTFDGYIYDYTYVISSYDNPDGDIVTKEQYNQFCNEYGVS